MASTPPLFPLILSPIPNFSMVTLEHSYNNSIDELRLHVLRKYRREIVDKVRFSDVSQQLIHCCLVSKEECFEICKLSVAQQMSQCYQKVHDIMDILICQKKGITPIENTPENEREQMQSVSYNERQNEMAKDIWNNFLIALKCQHGSIAFKMENELDKSNNIESKLKRQNSSGTGIGSRLKKEDIGSPTKFQHVQHFGLLSRTRSVDFVDLNKESSGTEENGAKRKQELELNEKDCDLQEFFKRAGVLPRHLENPKTRQIISKFIEDHGGMEMIKKEVRSSPRASSSENNLTLAGTAEFYQTYHHHHNINSTFILSRSENSTFSHPPPPYAPPSVPFEPTPKPTMDLYHF